MARSIRRKRANRVVAGSSRMTDIFHNPSLAEADSAQAYMAEQWKPERTRERYDWLFSYDATTAAV